MSSNNFPRVFLNKNEEKEIQQGYPWVFDNEISHLKHRADEKSEWKNENLKECTVSDGSVVEVYTKAGGFLGTGVFNRKSKITIRIIGSEHADQILENTELYFEKKVQAAVDLRNLYYSDLDSYRLIFGEADLIPGLICERFCDEENRVFIVIQFLSMSCDVFRKEILKALVKICEPDGIYERSDASVREKEGLPLVAGWLNLDDEEFAVNPNSTFDGVFTIIENGIKLGVDIENGQKTGYFLDQKFNRVAAGAFCKGKKVLDTFTHTGAFGLNAVKAGATEVISVDISPEAVEMVKHNIKINHAEKQMKAVCADVFDLLKKYEAEGEKFDVIILDPPASTKSRNTVNSAIRGYKEINLRGIKMVKKGGYFATCSCSHYMTEELLKKTVNEAAHDARRTLRQVEIRTQSCDHPILWNSDESYYLKFFVFQVC